MRLLLWAAILAGCWSGRAAPAERPPFAHAPLGVGNGCFVESVILLDRWTEQGGGERWTRLLQWGAREEEEIVAGHAVAVGEHRGKLWCWDVNRGWAALPVEPAAREDAAAVAAPVLRHYPRIEARYPVFRHDFPQAAGRPPALPEGAGAAVRDAVRAGEQLGRRRPVNVVRFVHGPAEAPLESAAAVFVFHGRYCVYLPERGTVPFRLRGDVSNLRLIQDLLRRSLPGARDLRRL